MSYGHHFGWSGAAHDSKSSPLAKWIFRTQASGREPVGEEFGDSARDCILADIGVQSYCVHAFTFMEDPNEAPRQAGCCDWQKTVEDMGERAQQMIREEPAKAVGLAVLTGLLLTVFPVGRVLGALVRLVFALARPLLLTLGALKLYEEFEKKQKP